MIDDYPALYRELAKSILAHEGELTRDTSAFVQSFAKQLRADNYTLSNEAESALVDYLAAQKAAIKSGIQKAAAIALQTNTLQSKAVLSATEQAFKTKWPDGLKLSDRLWRWDNDTRQGVTAVLRQGVKTGKAVDSVVMDMQRAIERSTGSRFKIVSTHADDWVTELHQAAQNLIHDPAAKAVWDEVSRDARNLIETLKTTGSRHAAERVYDQISQAVSKGREELLDKAVKWWTYDKQLYNLKRIARTEMATAGHRAVIDGTIDDETIIGYQWRLSASHPVTDICDYYAGIELGLGKGVWPKDQVPRHKAHPHCMCLLIPRVTQIQQKGSNNYSEFIKKLSPEQQKVMLPKWATSQLADGKDLTGLIRLDGFGLIRLSDHLSQQLAGIEKQSPTLAKQGVVKIVSSQAFKQFISSNQKGYYPVGIINQRLQSALGASVQTVRLSGHDRDKQARKSVEQGRNQYQQLQSMIDHGQVIQYRERAVSVYLKIDQQWHHAALQATQAGDEVYLKSLRRSDEKQLERDRKRGELISAD